MSGVDVASIIGAFAAVMAVFTVPVTKVILRRLDQADKQLFDRLDRSDTKLDSISDKLDNLGGRISTLEAHMDWVRAGMPPPRLAAVEVLDSLRDKPTGKIDD